MFCEPPMYGRHEDGTSSTIATHQAKLATNTTRGDDQLAHPAPEPRGRGDQVHEAERRQHEHRLQHLGEEAEADHGEADVQPLAAGVLERPGDAVGAERQHQHEHRVGVVEPEHQRGHRGQRQHRAGEQAGAGAEPPLDGGVQHADAGDAHQRLGHEDAPRRQAEDADREAHDPQRGRRLVDGDEVAGVARSEEQRLPALRTGLRRGGVERVGPPGGAEAPQVEHRGGRQQREQRGTGPARVVGLGRAASSKRRRPGGSVGSASSPCSIGARIDEGQLVERGVARRRGSACIAMGPLWGAVLTADWAMAQSLLGPGARPGVAPRALSRP